MPCVVAGAAGLHSGLVSFCRKPEVHLERLATIDNELTQNVCFWTAAAHIHRSSVEEDTDENPMAEYKKIQMQELNNSRLAMVAIIGLIVQATTTGSVMHSIAQLFIALVGGDYGGKLDIVNPVFTNWTSAVPEVPFQPPTIYPGQVWPQFTLKWPTLVWISARTRERGPLSRVAVFCA
eukprot:3053174-Amphidinium_carterae.1